MLFLEGSTLLYGMAPCHHELLDRPGAVAGIELIPPAAQQAMVDRSTK